MAAKELKILIATCALTVACVFAGSSWASKSTGDKVPIHSKYLLFQIFTFAQGDNDKEHVFPPQGEVRKLVHDIVQKIGTTGGAYQKLGFCVGPLALSQSDYEVRRLIKDSFDIARQENVAVAFHIDDQMFWGSHPTLQAHKPEVVEWIDWKRTPCTARRLEWGPQPARVAPSLCLNNPLVVDAVRKRAAVIGSEIKRELAALKSAGKAQLFAGVIEGWESRIGNDFDSGKIVGYHALANKGINSASSRAVQEAEQTKVLKQFMELWAMSMEQAGVPADKMYSHIAFTGQGLVDDGAGDGKTKISYAERFGFAVPEVAFSKYYRPGFSTYPLDDTIEQVRDEVAKLGGGAWISAEGTNVNPNQMAGESGMETYLAKMFNHGAMMVNIFSWGIGGDSNKDNFFRRATESAEAISAYRKFLSGQNLKESPRPTGQLSPKAFRMKIEKIQADLPAWIKRTHRTDQMQPMMEKLDALMKSGSFVEANAQADSILKVLNSSAPANSSTKRHDIIVSYAEGSKKMQLFRVYDDGSSPRRITNSTVDCSMPAWSRDGKKVVYLQESANGNAIWLTDPEGNHSKMLVQSGINMEPSWCPDSRHIVWFSITPGRKPPVGQLQIMDTETLHSRSLITDPEQSKFSNLMPAVSPDGTRLAFVSNRSGEFRIWTSNLDGSNAKLISPLVAEKDENTGLPIEQKVPSWSPDGRWIAHWEGVEMDHMSKFSGKSDPRRDELIEQSWNVWIVGIDGKNKRKAGQGDDPNWSPDGFVTRAFPDPTRGGANVMISTTNGWRELPIVPPNTSRYGRFTWKP